MDLNPVLKEEILGLGGLVCWGEGGATSAGGEGGATSAGERAEPRLLGERAESQEQMMQELVLLGGEVLQCNIRKRTLIPKSSGSLQKEALGWRKKVGV